MAASASRPRAGAGGEEPAAAYEDLLPVMGERLGTAGLLAELRAGFRLLADPARGAITPDSLRRGAAAALGVAGMSHAEADAMVREGDADADGALSEAEFCVLMVRLSPGIMADAEAWLADAIADELQMVDDDMDMDADADADDDGHGAAGGQDHAAAGPAGGAPATAARRSSV
ncbi:calcium-binding protein KIC [Sorghum bicolor]|uniref:calcium-binding protein KIC n=1 Tax=Sorghum bicolor TaxID=4558 RepID=UPI0001A85F18|nr:calcium-binding protein KIC [Sorghum bicolor]|eukprot:XP_002453223.1 calcium-binding protein KIC [Sorghum bicolor]